LEVQAYAFLEASFLGEVVSGRDQLPFLEVVPFLEELPSA
jgi:hypothetical protein